LNFSCWINSEEVRNFLEVATGLKNETACVEVAWVWARRSIRV